ncbi:MAG TPA: hypothetical protein VM324_09950 [Egibacteraceae bacterium]|nr:hypothetical protein [Egibacteraceae bacterium]
MTVESFAVVAGMALVWWIPTFKALTEVLDLQGVRRVLVWKWLALLCVPVVGWVLYFQRGRGELAADRRAGQRR